jgi:two-component system chemotaxis response regulator CheY
MRKILVKGLRDAGFGSCQITEAGDGASALGALRGSEFDLVLCDINMPGMDGLSFVRSARADPTISSELPIVMITTEGGREKVEEALAIGATDYLRKPFSKAQLQDKIAALLRG